MNSKFTKRNFATFRLTSAIASSFTHKMAISSIALATLVTSNGMALASAATSYEKTNASGTTELLAQTVPDAEIAVTDRLTVVAERKPAEFNATIAALTPYVVEGADGSVTLNAPAEVVRTVDQESYAAIVDSMNKANLTLQNDNAQMRRLPRIPWRQIYEAVKRAGQWVWYKLPLCTAAVTREWANITTSSPNPQDWIIPAAIVCGKAMR